MPQYKVTDPQSGKSLVLTGDSPPTESELHDIFAQHGEAPQLSIPDALKNKTVSNIASLAMGAADPILGLNSLLDKGVGGAGQFITSAGGLYPNRVSDYMGQIAKSGQQVADKTDAGLQSLRGAAGQSGFDPMRLVGNIASPANKAFPAPTSLLDAAGTGAAYGALQPTKEDASPLAPVGNAVAGAAGGSAGYGLGKLLQSGAKALGIGVEPSAPVPSVADLKSAASDKYGQAEAQGVIASKDSMQRMGQLLKEKMADEAIDPTNEPKAFAALGRVLNQDDNVTLKGLDKLRRGALNAQQGAMPSDKRLSRMIVDHIDDYVDNLSPADVVGGGDPSAASAALGEARDLWKRGAKGQTIEDLITKAQTNSSMFGQSGAENALRTQFRKLANSDRGMARFTPEEREAIRKVAMGGPIENAARYLGKLAPVGALPMAMELGAGLASPAAAIGTATVGLGGRAAATALTRRNAQLASELMRRGTPAAEQALTPATQALSQQGTQLLGKIPPALLAQLLQNPSGLPVGGQTP